MTARQLITSDTQNKPVDRSRERATKPRDKHFATCWTELSRLVGVLLVLAEHLESLGDLRGESLRRLEKVEEFPVVHLKEHACNGVSK